jgi:two-component system cell cycle sensor histidine kinase/response regulator CckA
VLCRLLGYLEHELLQLSIRQITHPDHVAPDAESMAAAVASGGPFELDSQIMRKDGSSAWVRVRGAAMHDEDGRPAYLFAMVEDVTEQRQLEEQLRQSQKMEAVGRLAGGVAHDFNNVLMAIGGYADLARRSVSEDEVAAGFLDKLQRAVRRATSMVDKLLAFSRKQVFDPRVIDVGGVLTDTGELLRRLLPEDIGLVSRRGVEPALAKVDPGQFQQVIMNLALNSRDAMPDGGTLTLSTEVVDLEAGGSSGSNPRPIVGPAVLLTVRDTGTGMSAEVQSRLFEPFFTTKEQGKGTGLGLYSAYGIVEQSQGHIDVDTAPGRGSTFRIYLPVADAPQSGSQSISPADPLPGGDETILVVEDDKAVRELVGSLLGDLGYSVLSAANGRHALEIAAERRGPEGGDGGIDLLLTDVVMPHVGGRDLAEQLGADHAGLKVLFVSGYTESHPELRQFSATGAAFVSKPISRSKLARQVRKLLDG